MSLLDDVVDGITDTITHIGLLTSSDPGDEISGGGYVRQSPTYPAASGGAADISATLEFDGPENAGPVTHLLYVRSGDLADVVRPVTAARSFNSDGRLDVTSAPVTASFPS